MSLASLELRFAKLQFTSKTRFSIYKKLIRFLKSSVPLPQALDIMYEHASDQGRKPKAVQALVLNEWRRNVRNGQNFARAISGWAPDKERIVIEAGEAAGRLDEAIENAVFIHQGSARIKKAIIGGLAYPFALVGVAIGFIILFGTRVIPAFEEILPKERWTGIGAQMAKVSDFAQNDLLTTLIGVGLAIVLFIVTLPRWTGHVRARFDRFPPWSLYRLSMGSGFLLSISAMHRAGIALTQALLILTRDASPWYRERIQETLKHVRNGQNLGEALYRTGFNFPDKSTVLDLRSYAELDGFDEVLNEMGRTWMEESIESIQAQAQVMKNVALLFMGGIFGWLIMGIFGLQGQIQNAATMGGL